MYRDRRAFWFGTGAVIAGVVLHLPMFLGAHDMHYRLVGMPVDAGMLAGMGLIVGGLALTVYGLVPAPLVGAPTPPPTCASRRSTRRRCGSRSSCCSS